MGTEIELKLAAPADAIRNAPSLPWLKRIAAGAVTQAKLQSVYFDTPTCALRNRGVSLRVRNTGFGHVQTIKSSEATPLGRNEWEHEIEGDQPRLDLADDTALEPLLSGKLRKRLRPMFETDVDRVAMPVRIGKSEVELAFDTGEVRTSADQHAPIAEVEIELKRGHRRDLARLLRQLAGKIQITYASRTKSERGYALLTGELDGAVKAGDLALTDSSSAAQAFVQIGLECLRHIGANGAAVRRQDPEGVHQMRVGLRRLRAALSLFKDMVRGAEVRRIKAELKWLTEQLGPARDRDVFLAKTVRPFRSDRQDRPELALLEEDIAGERQAGFARARAAVGSERFRNLLLDVTTWLLDGDWRNDSDPLRRALRQRPIVDVAARELKRRTRKVTKRVGKLERLDAARRHKLRIAVKKLRYARAFFAQLSVVSGGRRARRLDAALKRLQSALGDLNDMRVHASWAHDVARANTTTGKAFAIGYVVGCEDARSPTLLDEARAAGKRLERVA